VFLRWLHNIWKYFWATVLILLLTVIILGGSALGILQLDKTKSYLAGKVEDQFNQKYRGTLSIKELDGFLPFSVVLEEVSLVAADTLESAESDTVINLDRLEADIDIWSLLQNTLSIRRFEVDNPQIRLMAGENQNYTLFQSLKSGVRDTSEASSGGWIKRIEVIAPNVSVRNGSIFIERFFNEGKNLNLPEPFVAHSTSLTMFLELSEMQRFLDIEFFSARFEDLEPRLLNMSGQVYNDERFLEFNAFNLSTPRSRLRINGEIDGVDLYRGELSNQLAGARYNLDITSDLLHLDEFNNAITVLPAIKEAMDFSIGAEGTLDALFVDQFSFGVGESYFSIAGDLENLRRIDQLTYNFRIRDLFVRKKDVEVFTGTLDEQQYNILENLVVNGHANGSRDSVLVDVNLKSPMGALEVNANSRLKSPFKYSATLSGRDVNLGNIFRTRIDTTNLNFDASVNGIGYNLDDAVSTFEASFFNSSYNHIGIDNLELQVSLIDGFLEEEYRYSYGNERITGSGWIDFTRQATPFSFQGNVENLDLGRLLAGTAVPKTNLNMDYNMEIRGLSPDNIYGRANLDVKESVIGGDPVRPHQIYMDLDSPDLERRTFRMTSSLLDMNVVGDIVPSDMWKHLSYWKTYLGERIDREIRMQEAERDTTRLPGPLVGAPLSLSGNIKMKDIDILRTYLPELPRVETDLSMDVEVNSDTTRLLVTTDIQSDSLLYNETSARDVMARMTASFRSDRTLKQFSSLDIETEIGQLNTGFADMDSVNMGVSLKQDSLSYSHVIRRISKNASSRLNITALAKEDRVELSIHDFYLGTQNYAWINQEMPRLTYFSDKKWTFEDFRFVNRDEYISLQGILSPDREDSLKYNIRKVDLDRISNLVRGRVHFKGIMNGTFVTRSLTRSPSIQGQIDVRRFMIEDRLVGDVTFTSRYNQGEDRFDTNISIVTDSLQYAEYLENNRDVGQQIYLDGYFVPPKPGVAQDTVYNFNINFEEIDMWVIPHIAPKAFESVEGRAFGSGYLTGNLEDYDFHTEFRVDSSYITPIFLNTRYFATGRIIFDRQDWLQVDSLHLEDGRGGTGALYGNIDLKNFQPISEFDLKMRMNNLHFLNNEYDPDVPFYGSISGTGLISLSGLNTDMFLRTDETIRVTSDSRLSIPLLEETEFEETRRFIQFVDEFDPNIHKKPIVVRAENGEETAGPSIDQILETLTFTERFNLDLRFDAPNPMTVELIFDPVTGEVVKADGTGQLRLTMEEEDVQMFGRYNITGGSYQFVGGDIITRKLNLESGGTISWEGDPDNARLDIKAIYNARPSLSSLTGINGTDATEPGQGQRIPIELVVEITGTISSVENNYYFRLPNTLDIASNTAMAARINDINRNEEEKLFQATSILMTGQFISTSSSGEASSALTQNLSRGATYVNPLLSSQVISPLLSNQINALLKSDVSRLDIDFNLNAYNEIDLGVALRLYNDKIVFRREGQITGGGPETTIGERIGDINATYRINRGLSITAFHRQDQSLSSVTPSPQAGDVTATVDGIGLEARIQFNRWRNLMSKIGKTLSGVFGSGKSGNDEITNEDITSENTEK